MPGVLSKKPEEQLRDRVNQFERFCEKRYGRPVRESEQRMINQDIRAQVLDDEINGLRETLEHAAIAGE